MDNDTPMPFGKLKGTPLGKVPASYLLFLLYENIAKGELLEYIEENKDALEAENGDRSGKQVR